MKMNNFFASLKSLKKRVGSRVGSGSGYISQRYGSGDRDPDPHPNTGFLNPRWQNIELEFG
jgi:hypothetical protein